ncbi:MAG: hypothetical protein JSU65_08470 [Candidatus Zixiibacteriota bacterium]|nr:MAG: hypothetical protein JSU65_08470 [candidate division Zixibacteria bacterium]
MTSTHGKFGTTINCMDGRVQAPVFKYLSDNYQIDYVDTITEPGPTKALVAGDSQLIESIKSKVLISVEKHGSSIVAVVAHGDCAGNPIPKDESIIQTRQAVEVVKSWNLPVTVIGLWVGDERWIAELITD